MTLALANFIICSLGASICLFTLVTKHVDTEQPDRLFFAALMCSAFAIYLLSGMVRPHDIRLENLTARAITAIAMLVVLHDMMARDKQHGKLLKLKPEK